MKHNKKEALLAALEKSLGVVTTACKQLEIGRATYYRWLEEDKDFAKKAKELQDVALDFVESKLFEQIQGSSTAATIFYLKTKGKKRGYIERNELDLTSGDEPIKINVNIKGVEY
jgi:hypothetical protein